MAVCFGKTHRCAKECLRHWSDSNHPHSHRFLENQETIKEVLGSQSSDEELDRDLRKRNLSLRVFVREIPPVFASN
jgi:hypothetical protein